ncbi:hypothetical protein [Burkholderia ubonensis]|uniref:hypothetical protein n=1 Tax=Burkholderia ubonensis TaxID=101571 RepID=UPI000751BBA5|nr:hypothetical protein [Burkholderia ubonensis]KVO24015.1 hypothetical protein WJ72_30125 [Burkholderia ubonensis]KVQ82205.1 hypothetical protein WK05_26195 [Burkholderia ubonensis]KVV33595.1 hypothetical protein WK79_32180 [Burkholderia ubonensis]KVZ79283.1 hypothetical protein WL22_04370 [Burkholderia ubonensis]KWE29762.1 hypothetical protein WL75_03405 [Burkholderia ubonensis]
MFDEDAEDSKARAEQGRKNIDFRNFYESVKLDIRDEANAGNNKTTYRVSESMREFVDPVIDHLSEEGYIVTFEDGDRPALKISWENEDN